MPSNALPAAAAEIYQRLRHKYKVGFEPLKINDLDLQLLQVGDLEPFLGGKDPFKDVGAFPVWVKLWEASLILGHLLVGMGKVEGKSLLELGSGLGVPGLVAAAMGYRVTMSDYQEVILDFERVSAAANGLDTIDFKLIDWFAPPELPEFDVIAAAEIIYREDFFEPLLNLFGSLLAPGGVIYMAHDIRRKSLPKFLLLAEKKYDIAVSTRTMKTDGKKHTIIVNRLTPNPGKDRA